MDNQDLLDEISKWNTIFNSESQIDNSLYELAFFKVFIKFEKFLSICFENYAVGTPSSYGYCPNRRLVFDDIDHLNKVIKKENRSFVNHFDLIKGISECVFSDNPFDIIRTDAVYTNILNQMKVLRDYIAHESNAARNKYITNILNNRDFIEPYQHLLTIKRGTQSSYYTYYINSIVEVSNYIINIPSN